MRKIIVFGNSGSGKSTLAKRLSQDIKIAHLDLDTLAFKVDQPTERRCVEESLEDVITFLESNNSWVIEGGYSDILGPILYYANEVVYLDLPVKCCEENALSREWEPHKYESKEAQDQNLDMLINWIKDYYLRDDEFSKFSHDKLFEGFSGNKKRETVNQ